MIKIMKFENELTFEICTDEAKFDFHIIIYEEDMLTTFKMDSFETTIMNYFSVEDLPDYFAFEELTEIETLIMFDKYKNDLIKMCNKKSKEFLLREFKSLEIVEIFKNILINYKVGD